MESRRAARVYLIVFTLSLVAVGARAAAVRVAPPARVAYSLRLASAAYGVPLRSLLAVSFCESRWQPRADGVSGRKSIPGQTELSVPEPGRSHDAEELYASEFGADKLAEQKAAAERRCTCGRGDKAPLRLHKAGCAKLPRAGRR